MKLAVSLVFTLLSLVIIGCGTGAVPPPTFAEAGRASTDPSFGLPAEQGAGADGWSKERRADQVVADVARAAAEVEADTTEARRQRDVVRLECSNDKLVELRGLERTARDRRSALRTAIFDGDGEAEWSALITAADRARQLRAESRSCIGQDVAMRGARVNVEVDDSNDFADEDGRPDVELEKQVFRSKARSELSTDVVLGGKATAGEVTRYAAKQAEAGDARATGASGGSAASSAELHARDAPHDPSMLIRTADLTLAVYEVPRTLDAVERAARKNGGYLALRSDRRVTIRVPRERFETVLAQIERLGDVIHRNVAAEDVTDQFVDLEMRLKNATLVRARLEKLLEGATVRDAVEIHKELAKVTEEIERLQGKLKLLRDRISYSTITVALEPTEPTRLRSKALLPFTWMNVIGLSPLLSVPR